VLSSEVIEEVANSDAVNEGVRACNEFGFCGSFHHQFLHTRPGDESYFTELNAHPAPVDRSSAI
jgi:biotin carboxylase